MKFRHDIKVFTDFSNSFFAFMKKTARKFNFHSREIQFALTYRYFDKLFETFVSVLKKLSDTETHRKKQNTSL